VKRLQAKRDFADKARASGDAERRSRDTVTMMATLTLQRNVQFLYEEQLARIELAALGCTGIERVGDDAWQLRAHVNGSAREILYRSAYVGAVDNQSSTYAQLIRPAYQGGRFNRTRSVNQYLTHWIYPYRGKFHPQMVRALLNILGVGPGSSVCEPYLGSGTTALEASLVGANVVGVDISPLCVLLTRVKTLSWMALDEIGSCTARLMKRRTLSPGDLKAPRGSSERLREFLTIARMVTESDVARRQRETEASLRRNLSNMLESVRAHATAIREFGLEPGRVTANLGDSRNLAKAGIRDASIDAVVTSPPYSIALDYVKNDDHALKALGVDIRDLRTRMTGVRGRSAKEKLSLYNEDMQATFREVARVLRPGGGAAFVVGDATIDGREVTTTETMASWAEDAGLTRERSIPKIVFGLYNVMNDERILVFRK
jgi:hypothetical protein